MNHYLHDWQDLCDRQWESNAEAWFSGQEDALDNKEPQSDHPGYLDGYEEGKKQAKYLLEKELKKKDSSLEVPYEF